MRLHGFSCWFSLLCPIRGVAWIGDIATHCRCGDAGCRADVDAAVWTAHPPTEVTAAAGDGDLAGPQHAELAPATGPAAGCADNRAGSHQCVDVAGLRCGPVYLDRAGIHDETGVGCDLFALDHRGGLAEIV